MATILENSLFSLEIISFSDKINDLEAKNNIKILNICLD